jgi:hypothetical protein
MQMLIILLEISQIYVFYFFIIWQLKRVNCQMFPKVSIEISYWGILQS